MWTTSDGFHEALHSGVRQWRSRVDITYGDQVVEALDVVVDGSVALDDVAVRRAGKFVLVDPTGTLTPADAHDLLAPKGTEVRPYRGLMVDGQVEWVPLGTLGIAKPVVTGEAGGGTRVTFDAMDRVDAVRARRFVDPYVIASGQPTTQVIADMVTSRLPVATRLTVTGATTPALVYEALSDPWDAVRELATADSLVPYFDALGTLTVDRDAPVRTGVVYEPGVQSLLRSSERELDASRTYSGVIVRVEHPERDPIRVELWDDNPRSPTYAYGPFGKRPYGYSSPVITTEAQALLAAQTILTRVTKMRQELVLETIGHPGHDVGDVVTVRDPRTRTNGDWVVVAGTVQLRRGAIRLRLQELTADA